MNVDAQKINTTVGKDTIKIEIHGFFDFSMRSRFQDAYKNQSKNILYIVDMSRSTSLDSTAIGMLLSLSKHVDKDRKKLHIVGCGPNIRKIFAMSHLDAFMTIVPSDHPI